MMYEFKVSEMAEEFGVHRNTIRNWIKTGYLTQLENRLIEASSLDRFINQVAGSEKLISRANKSQKDSHDHPAITDQFLGELNSPSPDLEAMGPRYEKALSQSHKNKEGIYYTPRKIVADLMNFLEEKNTAELTFCDPCCGSGEFLMEALERGFRPQNIFGFDTDPVACALARKRIEEKTGFQDPHIVQQDFLSTIARQPRHFDCLFTNPPWGKKLKGSQKRALSKIFPGGEKLDTSALFLIAVLKSLKPGGWAGLLLPESFFTIAAFRQAREEALRWDIRRLVDYGKPFKGLVTRAQGLVLQKKPPGEGKILCETESSTSLRAGEEFRRNPKAILNFTCSSEEAALIDQLYGVQHITLKGNARWGMGIVTGSNKRFCSPVLREGYMPVYKGTDITPAGLKKPTTFIPRDTSLYQQTAPRELYEAEEKLIYRFISSDLCFLVDKKQNYLLNSANMVLLDEGFPLSGEQTAALLNSSLINWLFRKLFNTHKILRGDIEALPLHYGYFNHHEEFSEEAYRDYLNITIPGN